MEVKPAKLIRCTMIFDQEYVWDKGGAWDGYGYRWDVIIGVPNPQVHSNPNTNTPYEYNCLDIKVGDWLAGGDGQQTVKIVEILQTPTPTINSIKVIAEDVDRFNIMSDNTVTGIARPTTTDGIVYELDDEGMPILGPLAPYYLEITAINNLNARFQYRNYLKKFIHVEQTSHGFTIGDIIKPDVNNVGKFVKAGSEVSLAIGIVTSIDIPTVGNFTFKPIGKLVDDVSPNLIGNYGDLFYIDPNVSGSLTKTRPTSNIRPLYMRLDSPTKAIMLNAGVEDNVVAKRYEISFVANGQTEFTLPNNAVEVLEMSINGIDTKHFTYDADTHILTFDYEAEGYELETSDSVYFIYRT